MEDWKFSIEFSSSTHHHHHHHGRLHHFGLSSDPTLIFSLILSYSSHFFITCDSLSVPIPPDPRDSLLPPPLGFPEPPKRVTTASREVYDIFQHLFV
ncbi:hypothetical protein E2C01_002871 [Portunus trituberculatus]|uniref:Uncharacterized protein n=1 Tax=Portunus trituberculatus TaxID=210409 RepID=A0A5B7CL16_PORTR|nr:hypothetical protein [Portunus trituberculatus]